jgi:hypothetical protein
MWFYINIRYFKISQHRTGLSTSSRYYGVIDYNQLHLLNTNQRETLLNRHIHDHITSGSTVEIADVRIQNTITIH